MTHFDTPKMGLVVKTREEIIKKIKKQKIQMVKPETKFYIFPIKTPGVPCMPRTQVSTKQPG